MKKLVTVMAASALTASLAACTSNSPESTSAAADRLDVVSTDTECQVSAATGPSGTLTFTVKNAGSKITEFYLLGEDGLRILGEVENIGPQLTRDLVLKAAPGKYFTACKPGMVGNGIRQAFTVTDSGADLAPTGDDKAALAQANSLYGAYVRDQAGQLLTETQKFVKLFNAGKTAQAKQLYPRARMHWERIETVAESFGDLDPRMDLREADLEPGQKWTGWHVAEKDLWAPKGYRPLTSAQRAAISAQLLKDTTTLNARVRTMTFTADHIGNGAKGLLDEVATGKVTGEEEAFSHTDLYDFQANVDGARVAWQGLQPLLKRKDQALDANIALKFAALQKLLNQHKQSDGFVSYTSLSKAQVKALSDAVNALSEPVSKITATVV